MTCMRVGSVLKTDRQKQLAMPHNLEVGLRAAFHYGIIVRIYMITLSGNLIVDQIQV